MIDQDALTTWLTDRARADTPIVGAIYQGALDRIKRGDFDTARAAIRTTTPKESTP